MASDFAPRCEEALEGSLLAKSFTFGRREVPSWLYASVSKILQENKL